MEVGFQVSGVRKQRAEVGRQRTEDRSRKTDDRGQKREVELKLRLAI
jgi:hypothetical protein